MKGKFFITLGLAIAVIMFFAMEVRGADIKTGSEMIKITIGAEIFTIVLEDNAAVSEFLERLPLTLLMRELNDNEKYASLPVGFPSDSSTPLVIHSGDLMLYGDSTLVLFYETFSNSYSYTRLGRVISPMGLKAALGGSDVSIKFDKM